MLYLQLWCSPAALLVATSAPPFTERLPCSIFIRKGVPPPTNAFFEVDFGNGKTQTATSLVPETDARADTATHTYLHKFINSEGYTNGGTFDVNVRVWNLVGEVNLTAQVDIYTQIYALKKVPFIVVGDENTTTQMPGLGFDNAYYPVGPILFTTSAERLSHVTYRWNFGENKPSTYQTTTDPDIVHTFTNPGAFLVTLNATNPMSQVILQRIVHIQRTIANINLFTAQNPYHKNRTFHFTIDAGSVGTDACYFVDFQDVSSTTPYLYFAGNQTQCQESFPTQWAKASARRFDEVTNAEVDANPSWTVANHYMTKGRYQLTLIGVNQVSRMEFAYELLVTRGPCFKPVVKVKEHPHNICIPGTTQSLLFVSNIFYSPIYYIYSKKD